eukprot:2728744-Alexandrium_andersonii.AAC.1
MRPRVRARVRACMRARQACARRHTDAFEPPQVRARVCRPIGLFHACADGLLARRCRPRLA